MFELFAAPDLEEFFCAVDLFGALPYESLLLQVITDQSFAASDSFDVSDQIFAFLVELVESFLQVDLLRGCLAQHLIK